MAYGRIQTFQKGNKSLNDEYVSIGRSYKLHGLKGGFVFVLFNQIDSLLKENLKIQLVPLDKKSVLPVRGESFKLTKINFGSKVIAYLDEITSIDHASKLLPFEIRVSKSLFPPLPEDEFYVNDLIGLEVYQIKDDHKEHIGHIESSYHNGHQEILEIIYDGDKGRIELPFIDKYFPVIDIQAGYVQVIIPEFI